jgi:hypothetical protein
MDIIWTCRQLNITCIGRTSLTGMYVEEASLTPLPIDLDLCLDKGGPNSSPLGRETELCVGPGREVSL